MAFTQEEENILKTLIGSFISSSLFTVPSFINLVEIYEVTDTTYAVTDADDGRLLYCTNAAGCTITLDSVTTGTNILAVGSQNTVQFAAGSGVTIRAASAITLPATSTEAWAVINALAITATDMLVYGSAA